MIRDQVDETNGYLSNFFNGIVDALPNILGAIVILLIGWIVAKAVAAVIRRALGMANFNGLLHSGQGGSYIQRAVPNPAGLVSKIAYWLIFLFALSMAASALGIPVLQDIIRGIYSYIPNILAAIVIFLVAGAISGAVATFVANVMGDTPTGKVVATAAPILVMGIATFMILDQLKIAPTIITITYAGLVATAALAFGLGGREAASRMFMGLYDNAAANKDRVVADARTGADRTKDKARDLKNRNRR